jgi:hypothetical protein
MPGEDVVDACPWRKDHRRTRGERLQWRETPGVALAQDREYVGGRVGVLQLGVGQGPALQLYALAETQRRDLVGETRGVGWIDVV